MYKIPLKTYPNQTFNCTIPIDGVNKHLKFKQVYNTIGGYWMLSISDANTGKDIISNINLVSTFGVTSSNIMHLYKYLNIGSAYIVSTSDDASSMPNSTNLGKDYILIWGDTK